MQPATFVVQDFQSLEDVRFSLGARSTGGGLTTVVGPSSTGKSAVVRAIKLLYENGNPAVRAGASRAVVAVIGVDGAEVEVSRGASHSVYRISHADGTEDKYPKAGRSVPEEVAAVLNLAEGGVHFASQFDPPYLLADPGSKVSQVIGAFTHAEEMQAAAREGNRRRLRAKSEMELRVSDMKETARRVKGLEPEKLSASRGVLDSVKDVLARAETLASKRSELAKAVAVLDTLAEVEAQARARVEELPASDVDLSVFGPFLEERTLLQEFLAREELVQRHQSLFAEADGVLERVRAELAALEAEIEICPSCGRPL